MSQEAIWGAIGALAGMILREIFRAKRAERSEASQIRIELREEVTRLYQEIRSLSGELDAWKQKFYDLSAENLLLKEKCKFLEFEIDKLKGK